MTVETKRALIAAGLGATAPNLFKLAVVLTGGPVKMPGAGYALTYSLGLVVMAAIGVGIAFAFKETNMRKAFFIGLGLPSFLQVSMSNLSAVKESAAVVTAAPAVATAKPGDSASLPVGFIGVAYADEHVRTAQVGRRTATPAAHTVPVKTLNIETAGDKKPDGIIFYTADKKVIQSLPAQDQSGGAAQVTVPPNAQSFAVQYDDVVSQPVALEPTANPEQNVSVNIEQKTWSGLLRAVGYNSAPKYEVGVEKK
jgi:hypothetical protein